MIPMDGSILDVINNALNDAGTLFKAVFSLVVFVLVGITCVKSNFSLPKVVMAVLCGGLALWIVLGDGLTTMSEWLSTYLSGLGEGK